MSDVTGGSLVQGSSALDSNAVFNLHDEKDVVTLLRRIHQAPLPIDHKNELRDAVFSYRSTPEGAVTDELKALFLEQGFNIDTKQSFSKLTKKPEKKFVQSRLGSTRPSPIFASTAISSVQKEAEELPVESKLPTEEQKIVPEASKLQVPPAPEPVEVPTEIVAPKSSEVNVASPVENPVVPAASTNTPERIKEIKKSVNLLVGNPVNLIDVNNEVGREYMNSLLDAMKKNNGGSSSEVHDAMERLEKAFVSVKQTVESNKGKISSEKEIPKTPQEPTATPIPPPVAENVPEVKLEIPTQETKKEEKPAPVSGFASVHQTHVEEQKATPSPVVSVPKIPSVPKNPRVIQESVNEPSEPLQTTPAANTTRGIMSVAKEKQIQDLLTSQKQAAAVTDQQKETARIASMDPLMTPEVTSGLQQLLSEWALFKSSGIFGTGGSGMEHPLYKQLANLNMAAVIAGRFEGASPQVKRSITDYMNGWRYEEGIMQEQGELFEHYLRRVIKHILDKRPAVPKE